MAICLGYFRLWRDSKESEEPGHAHPISLPSRDDFHPGLGYLLKVRRFKDLIPPSSRRKATQKIVIHGR